MFQVRWVPLAGPDDKDFDKPVPDIEVYHYIFLKNNSEPFYIHTYMNRARTISLAGRGPIAWKSKGPVTCPSSVKWLTYRTSSLEMYTPQVLASIHTYIHTYILTYIHTVARIPAKVYIRCMPLFKFIPYNIHVCILRGGTADHFQPRVRVHQGTPRALCDPRVHQVPKGLGGDADSRQPTR